MDGEKETVSVKWWNHKSALCRAIRDIYMKNLYADVRLICEGNEHWVHKFVLSACSEYFEDILAEVPHQGFVNLPSSVRQKELLSLLDFMYLGIVDVLQEELPTLVGAAEVLMIRGLAIPYEEEESDQENVKVTKEIVSTPKTPKVDTNQTGISLKREKIDDESLTITKQEVGEYYSERHLEPSTSNAGLVSGRSPDQNCQVTSSNAEVNAMLKVLIGKSPKRGRKRQARGTNDDAVKSEGVPNKEPEALTCSQCNKTFQWRSNLTKHMRTHTGEKPYSCNICTYKTSYSEALKRHMRIHTGEKPYQCDYCDYKSRDHGSLKHHLKRHCSSRSSNPSSSNPQDSEQHLHSNTVISESSSAPDFMTLDSDRQQRSETISEAFITSHVNSGNVNT